LNELGDYSELLEMFNSFLSSFEAKIRIMKGKEKEVEIPLNEAVKETSDKWIKVENKKDKNKVEP
jgi:hypothetical protein